MKLAICNETFQDWPFDKAFDFARQCGYSGIEIAPFTIDKNANNISSAQRSEVRKQAEAADLEVIGLHWLLAFTEGYYLTSPEAEIRTRTASYLAELASLCRDLSGNVLVLGSPQQRNLLPDVTHEAAMKYAADVIAQALPALERHQVVLAVEPLGPAEGDFLLTADLGAELVEMLDSPYVRLHLDVKAMSSESTPIPEIIKKHAGITAHFHANDANKLGPGMGEIDFVPILKSLQDANYTDWVSVEVFDYTPGVETLAQDSIAYLQKCLAEL